MGERFQHMVKSLLIKNGTVVTASDNYKADIYIEDVKSRIDKDSFLILNSLFLTLLKLLHPTMPFVTEEIYQRFNFGQSLMIDSWPKND